MNISFSIETTRELKRLKTREPLLYKKIQKQLTLFKENPKHPSLRTQKLQGNLSNSWSISIERNIRMLYFTHDDETVFFLIGTHDEVYKK